MRPRHRYLRSALIAASGVIGSLASAPGASALVTVSPAVGGQGSTFVIGFRSDGPDEGPDDDGDELRLAGPPDTECADLDVTSRIFSFSEGRARLLLGPHPPRQAFKANAYALRLVTRWCPGRYEGEIDHISQMGPTVTEPFSFRVRRSKGIGGLVVPTDQELDPRPPTNPSWMKVRQLPGRMREIRLAVRIGGRGLQAFEIEMAPPSPCPQYESQPTEGYVNFRPGAGVLTLGGPGPRLSAHNHRHMPSSTPMCSGRWIGYFGDTPFTFVVRRR